MFPAKRLRYVAVPANWKMRFKDVRQLIQLNFTPAQQLTFSVQQRRSVVHPVKFWKTVFAIDALFAPIPLHQHTANQTSLGRDV